MKQKIVFLFLGALFGLILSRAGATTPGYYAQLFLFEDLQLMWVILSAASLGLVGIQLMKRLRPKTLMGGAEIAYQGKPMTRTLIVGSLLFGAGWGLSGACPGTALAMLGEGRVTAVFVLVGITLGTWVYGLQNSPRGAKEAG